MEEKSQSDILTESDFLEASTQITRSPTGYFEITQFFSNFRDLCGVLFEEKYILYSSLCKVEVSFQKENKDCIYCFGHYDDFGACFVTQIHTKVQLFISSCVLGSLAHVNFEVIDFTTMIRECVEEKSHVTDPNYLNVERLKKQRKI